jgi:hypothetical protein
MMIINIYYQVTLITDCCGVAIYEESQYYILVVKVVEEDMR